MSQKLQSQGSSFGVMDPNVGSPDAFTIVGGVSGINGFRSGTATEIDVSDLQSTEKEYQIGLADPGSGTVAVFYDPRDPGQIILENARTSRARHTFQIAATDLLSSPAFMTLTFDGFVQSFDLNLAVDAAQTSTVTIRVTGPYTKQ